MFNVVTGPFHPTLELTLVQEIQRLKSSDSLAPIAIVVPSESLRRRLQWLLCVDHQCSLFDVHFLTFHQLALRLHHEYLLFNGDSEVMRLDLVHDLCFEHLLTSVTNEHAGAFEELAPARSMTGIGKALWRTIRDLKEAMVDPKIALQGVEEGLFGIDEQKKLQNLFTVYAMVQETSRTLYIGSADDLASLMIPWVKESLFLSRVAQVCYYGFYDLTQVQLSLFEALAAKCRMTVYFPLSDGPAFSFARRFFERHLCSGSQNDTGQEVQNPVLNTGTGSGTPPQVQVMHTVGPEDELSVVCKEIMKLVENHQFKYEDIGIVARNLKPYQSSLRRTFAEHRIPFTSSATIPVIQEPLIKHLIQLSSLPSTDFFWRDVLDVLTSPFYRLDRFGVTRDEIHSEQWHQAVRTLGLHRGQDQWSQLTSLIQEGVNQEMEQARPTGECERAGIDPKHLQLLARITSELIADCHALPTQGTIGDLTQAFLSLAKTHLALSGSLKSPGETFYEIPNQGDLNEVVQQALTILEDMQVLDEIVTWEQWAQLFQRALNACTMTMEPDLHAGVRVLDAMSARGLPFRALFLLGLNEKVFPRFIREDAFLRDRSRRVLEETFGYKIDEKLGGYDEEQLLFTLLGQAAQERFYLVYQRADKEGRPLAPSPYLTEYLSSVPESNSNPEVMIPRRMSDRFHHPLFGSGFLTREELGLKLIFQGYHPGGLLEMAGREPQLFQNGWEALLKIERSSRQLGVYDGILGPIDSYWRKVMEKGVSPTSLEDYARCPFQYFARHLLQLESMRAPNVEELLPVSLGKLCHEVLQATYRKLISDGWPGKELSTPFIREEISSIGANVFDRFFKDHATGYFLTWQLAKDKILRLVTMVIEADQQDYCENGFRPVAFEVYAEGKMVGIRSPNDPMKIHGRLDRVDQRNNPPEIRIVDYKFTASSEMKRKHRDLLLSANRGFYLQPPVYAMMTKFHHQELEACAEDHRIQPGWVEFLFLAPGWETQVVRSGFDPTTLQGSFGRQIKNTIRSIVNGIHAGRYFILPDDYCGHCDFSTACRRFHRPTWGRSHGAAQARQLRQLRTQDLHGD
ncbi:MAG: exodeoxyribonuclease V subunit gamma [Nitrospirota bacterium]|nr:MAG: exodeoxyribonuclease V subunit gamma [Nitrospirota bacterium]